jgi:hypothetical protein
MQNSSSCNFAGVTRHKAKNLELKSQAMHITFDNQTPGQPQELRLDIVCTAILGKEREISGNHVIPMQVKDSWVSIHHGIDQFLLFLWREHQPPHQTWVLERMKIVEFGTRALHPKAPLGELRVGLEHPGPSCATPYRY